MQAMQAIIDEAAEAIRSIGGTIGRVDDIAVAIAAAVEEQNAATAEIARNVQEAADGTRNVTGSIDGVMKAASRRSEEHTSELQSLMRISYAVFCLKKNKMNYSDTCRRDPYTD